MLTYILRICIIKSINITKGENMNLEMGKNGGNGFLKNIKNLVLVLTNAMLLVVGIVFTIILIISSNRPVTLNKEYKFEKGVTLSDDYFAVFGKFDEEKVYCEIFEGNYSEELTLKYKVVDGEFYACKVGYEDWTCIGTISPYKITIDKQWLGERVTLECNGAKTLKTVSIVLLCVAYSGSVVLAFVNYTNYKKAKRNTLLQNQEI